MQKTLLRALPVSAVLLWFTATLTTAGELTPIALPPPQTDGGKPLMQALKERRSERELKNGKLPAQTLANLLWAAFGINRPGNGHRTAPSAMNSQEVDIYVALPAGLSAYDAKAHALTPVLGEDVRFRTSGQSFGTNAPVVLIYVADLSRLTKAKPEQREFYAAIDTGCIVQNVYLCCASQGLATVVYAQDGKALAARMKLRPDQKIILAQAVGYPADASSPAPATRPGRQ